MTGRRQSLRHTRKPRARRTTDDDPTGRYAAAASKGKRRRSSGVSFASCVTKYPGSCQRCGVPIPIGTHVRCLLGTGRIWHTRRDCGAETDAHVANLGPAPSVHELAVAHHKRFPVPINPSETF